MAFFAPASRCCEAPSRVLFKGELRATGQFIRDQLVYLSRCGFDSFQMADESLLEDALASLADFSEFYQASANQPLPLFRRRPG